MKTCIHCGAELPEGARFCHRCAGVQVRKKRVRGPFPWRRTVVLILPVLTLLCLLWAFYRPAAGPIIEATTTEEDGPTYHATRTKIGDTVIAKTHLYTNGNANQVIYRLDGTRRAEYYIHGDKTEYLEFYPDDTWSFHINGVIGYGATAFSYDENGNVTEAEWVDDVVSYLEKRRLKVDDVIEEYTQEILDTWDDSPQ